MVDLLEIRNIRKSFGNNVVLKDMTFNVPPGAIVGFIGDNGAGKSTTIKTVLGLVSHDTGTVKIFDEENINIHPEKKEMIGVVFDAMNLPAHLTIKQLNNVLKKLYNTWDQNHFYQLIHSFHLPMDKKVNEFSRGMSMKLSIAVALSHHAKLLLLDEATGGLDPSSREEVLEEIINFVKYGDKGVLLSSHIMSDIEKVASHLVFIKEGEVLLSEEKDKVIENYAIVDVHENQLPVLNKNIVVAKRNHGSHFSVLVSDRKELPEGIDSKNFSMDELSVFLTRSEK
ncbi:ABC transporter ATP-binding protein [Salinibacillus aidingensis]|uniref:ABC transporter ATP-binding protein n=1 Tax=Salinibacillus aidingensis TaxID=237684 RepID=A0ABP3LDQ5_9BACI